MEKERRSTKDAMHRRVEDSLAFRLTMYRLRALDSNDLLQRDLDELPLFAAIGALTDEQAAVWRERVTLAAEAFGAPDNEVVDEGQRIRARDLLSEALADYEASKASDDEHSFWRFTAVLPALKAIGAVSEHESAEWDRKFHEMLDRKSKPRREARQREERQARQESRPEAPRYEAAELVRVVPGQCQRLSGVSVTCAELYEDCVVVRWHRVLSAEEIGSGEQASRGQPTLDALAARFGAALSLEDDLGTAYAPATPTHQITGDKGLSENDKPVPVWGKSVFLPAVPERVKRLTVLNGHDEFALELT